jgi:hypothetical protein
MEIEVDGIVISLLHQIENFHDDNVDAVIRFSEGDVWTVTFFTIQNIKSIVNRYQSSGECLSGKFFWARDLVIVEDLRPETIEATVLELIRSGEYVEAFGRR